MVPLSNSRPWMVLLKGTNTWERQSQGVCLAGPWWTCPGSQWTPHSHLWKNVLLMRYGRWYFTKCIRHLNEEGLDWIPTWKRREEVIVIVRKCCIAEGSIKWEKKWGAEINLFLRTCFPISGRKVWREMRIISFLWGEGWEVWGWGGFQTYIGQYRLILWFPPIKLLEVVGKERITTHEETSKVDSRLWSEV
jgi:hypothetical protein